MKQSDADSSAAEISGWRLLRRLAGDGGGLDSGSISWRDRARAMAAAQNPTRIFAGALQSGCVGGVAKGAAGADGDHTGAGDGGRSAIRRQARLKSKLWLLAEPMNGVGDGGRAAESAYVVEAGGGGEAV